MWWVVDLVGGGGGGSVKVALENMIIDFVRCRIRQDFQISVKFFRATITCARKYSAPPKQKILPSASYCNVCPLNKINARLFCFLFVLCFMNDAYIYSKKSRL